MPITLDGTNGITQAGEFNSDSSFGFKNRIINGAMVIDQRNAGASVTPTGDQYTLDRWSTALTQASKFTVQQNAGSVTPPVGFINYLGVTSSSAYSITSTDQFGIYQAIEGLNVTDLGWGTANAKTVTLSFWARSSLTGTFGGSLRNSAVNRSYPFSYTISAANTWEQKSITIAGDTSGTWLTTNGVGIYLTFGLGVVASLSGTAGAWAGTNYVSATGATSVVGTNGATLYITGVQLEVGSTATSFDYRPYGTELALCQRYYFKQQATGGDAYFGSGFNTTTTRGEFLTTFPVVLRTAPTALEQSGTAGNYRVTIADTNVTCSAVPAFIGAELFSARTRFEVSSGLTAGQGSFGRSVNSSAYLAWSAEL
jgi:hypothetical protein